jgi:O-antigen/teichoic acid export membrane protein
MLGRHLIGFLPVNIAQAIVGFGSVIVLTRVLAPEQFGLYALAFSAAALVHTATLTWVEAAAHRFLARAREDGALPDHFATLLGLWACALAALACASGIVFWVMGLESMMAPAMAFALVHAGVRTGVRIALETRRAGAEVGRYALVETGSILGGFACGLVAVVWLDMGAAGPFAGALVATAVALAFEAPMLWRRARGGKLDTVRVRSYAFYGLPVALALGLDLALAATDRFLIAHLLGPAAVGAYFAGYNLAARVVDVVFVWAGMAFAPLATAAFERGGTAAVRTVARRAFETMLALALPAAAGLALVAQPLSGVLVGPALAAEAALVIPWIAFAAVLNGLSVHYLSEAFLLARRTGVRAALMVGPIALNAGLTLMLVPVWGLAGAAMATLAAYGVLVVALAVVGRTMVALPLAPGAALRIALATAGMAGAVAGVDAALAHTLEPVARLAGMVLTGIAAYGVLAAALDVGSVRTQVLRARTTSPAVTP